MVNLPYKPPLFQCMVQDKPFFFFFFFFYDYCRYSQKKKKKKGLSCTMHWKSGGLYGKFTIAVHIALLFFQAATVITETQECTA